MEHNVRWEAFVQKVEEFLPDIGLYIVTVGRVEPGYVAAMFAFASLVHLCAWSKLEVVIISAFA